MSATDASGSHSNSCFDFDAKFTSVPIIINYMKN